MVFLGRGRLISSVIWRIPLPLVGPAKLRLVRHRDKVQPVEACIAATEGDWYWFLSQRPDLDQVTFSQAGVTGR